MNRKLVHSNWALWDKPTIFLFFRFVSGSLPFPPLLAIHLIGVRVRVLPPLESKANIFLSFIPHAGIPESQNVASQLKRQS